MKRHAMLEKADTRWLISALAELPPDSGTKWWQMLWEELTARGFSVLET